MRPKLKILLPPPRVPSKRVQTVADLADADAMREMINGYFNVGQYRTGYALSHSQVSPDPFRYFVVNQKMEQYFGDNWLLVNGKIHERSNPFTHEDEACLSFPFRPPTKKRRWGRVIFQADVPYMDRLITCRFELFDLAAVIAQHEMDHANNLLLF
jgi:peptide deformylase